MKSILGLKRKNQTSPMNPITSKIISDDSIEEFALDGVGNRQSIICNQQSESYTVNNLNQYTKINDSSLTYDANGNLTSRRIPLMMHLRARFGFHNFPKGSDWENDKCARDADEDDEDGEPDELNDLKNDFDDCEIDEHKAPSVEIEWKYAYDYANRLIKVSKTFLVRGNPIFTRDIAELCLSSSTLPTLN